MALSLFFAANAAAAQALAPDELVRKVTADVLDAIKSDQQLQAGDRKKALALAEQKILPLVDFQEATQLAVGRSWSGATPEQKERLVNEFRSHAGARLLERDRRLSRPDHEGPAGAHGAGRHRSHGAQPVPDREGRPPVAVNYSMKQTPTGWKIYDINIEGVSLVLTYRSEFEQITRVSGIDGLIKRLQEKNA